MSDHTQDPRAVLFDAYGTLFDVYSVSQLAEQLFPCHGEKLSVLWRDKHIEYTRLTSMSGRWRPFRELTVAGLRFATRRLGLALTPAIEDQFMALYGRLPAFQESREVLQALQTRGVRAGILSNGDPEMLVEVVGNAGLADLLDPLLSVHETRRYKTDPACYAIGPAALGLPANEILFVSSNGWDAIGATWYGYTTLWVNRSQAPLDALDTEPTLTGKSLLDALAFFRPKEVKR